MKELVESCHNTLYNHPYIQNLAQELHLGQFIKSEMIQSLWSGYGELVRLHYETTSIIVKHVKLPKKNEHPKGWNTNLSHLRKLHSYDVEVNWYENFTKEVDEKCFIPKGIKTFKSEHEWLIVMQDLASIGLHYTTKEANEKHLKLCLKWLANFHAKYLNRQSDKLWKMGTYWHLDTRPDELEAMDDELLKSMASCIDQALQTCQYQTIVHGDAKLANFCFDDKLTQCAAVDFQYVGHGCGMKDLILFMSSAVDPLECNALESWVLDSYFEALKKALTFYQPKIDASLVEKEWRLLFDMAWADFVRFLKGWSPEHFKINEYSKQVSQRALNSLKNKGEKSVYNQ